MSFEIAEYSRVDHDRLEGIRPPYSDFFLFGNLIRLTKSFMGLAANSNPTATPTITLRIVSTSIVPGSSTPYPIATTIGQAVCGHSSTGSMRVS